MEHSVATRAKKHLTTGMTMPAIPEEELDELITEIAMAWHNIYH